MGCGESKSSQAQEPRNTQPKQEQPKAKVEEPPKQIEDKPANVEESANSEQPAAKTEEWSEFELTALRHHNEYRALHGCPPMTLNRDLCTIAQNWADHLADKKSFEHSTTESKYQGKNTGENLYMTASSAPNVNGDGATKSWYDEIKDYSWDNPGFSMQTGHFTQVIWKGSSQLGVACATYEADGWHNMVVVGNYFEAGNMMGAFEENVPELL